MDDVKIRLDMKRGGTYLCDPSRCQCPVMFNVTHLHVFYCGDVRVPDSAREVFLISETIYVEELRSWELCYN